VDRAGCGWLVGGSGELDMRAGVDGGV
jgi:hypothetical protein